MTELNDDKKSLEEKNIYRMLMEIKELKRQLEDVKDQNEWLTEKLSTRKTDQSNWTPSIEYEAKLYRGWRLDREPNHGMIVVLNKDDTPAPEPLGYGRYTKWMEAEKAIDDYMKKYKAE